jgi:hypothetical protein
MASARDWLGQLTARTIVEKESCNYVDKWLGDVTVVHEDPLDKHQF